MLVEVTHSKRSIALSLLESGLSFESVCQHMKSTPSTIAMYIGKRMPSMSSLPNMFGSVDWYQEDPENWNFKGARSPRVFLTLRELGGNYNPAFPSVSFYNEDRPLLGEGFLQFSGYYGVVYPLDVTFSNNNVDYYALYTSFLKFFQDLKDLITSDSSKSNTTVLFDSPNSYSCHYEFLMAFRDAIFKFHEENKDSGGIGPFEESVMLKMFNWDRV